jgi:predicted P-loop ATPase/GTPase
MPNYPVTEHWPEIKRLAELGVPVSKLAEEYNVNVGTIYTRSRADDWLIPSRLQTKLRENSSRRLEAIGDPLFDQKAQAEKSESLLVQTWEERASNLRDLSFRTAYKAIAQAEGQVVIESASDLKHAVHVARQATGLLDTDQPQVQLSLFAGGMEMGPPVRDLHAESVQSIPVDAGNDGFWD